MSHTCPEYTGLRNFSVRDEAFREGGYWPRRSERTLRTEVDQLKDASEDGDGVQVAIFAHPQFERLEAEGERRLAKRARI
jgi:hypothetical protein